MKFWFWIFKLKKFFIDPLPQCKNICSLPDLHLMSLTRVMGLQDLNYYNWLISYLNTSQGCGPRTVRWVWHRLRHKQWPGRKRRAMSDCSGFHASPLVLCTVQRLSYFAHKFQEFAAYLAAWIPSQVEASLMRILSFSIPCSLYILISLMALATLAALSKDSLKIIMSIKQFLILFLFSHFASTSVETRPGTIFKISVPKRTSNLSMDSSNFSALVLINYATDVTLN